MPYILKKKLSSQLLYTKLFTVMGLLWVFEVVDYLVQRDRNRHWDRQGEEEKDCFSTSQLFLRAIGCLNLLRGCLFFFIFVCKPSTLTKVSPNTVREGIRNASNFLLVLSQSNMFLINVK